MNQFDALLKCDGVAAAFNRKMSQARKDSFPEYLARLLKNYKKTFFNLPWDFGSDENNKKYDRFKKGIQKHIDTMNKGINDSIAYYLEGRPSEAYQAFAKMMDFTIPSSTDFIPTGRSVKHLYTNDTMFFDEPPRLFRMRASLEQFDVTERKHIFHVPFEDRHKIRSARYSILGFPCLYLGGSLYTCWEEMGRPNFDNIFFSRFKGNRHFNVLLVAWRSPRNLVNRFNKQFSQDNGFDRALHDFVKYFARWPLDLACAIPRKEGNAIFHPEYIIPQLLLQWMIQDGSYDALCYRSVRIPDDDITDDWRMNLNFVFPPKAVKSKGYSKHLQDLFVFTDPISWELAIALNDDPQLSQDFDKGILRHDEYLKMKDACFAPVKGKAHRYVASDFGKAEILAATLNFLSLESCD